jgi:transcriptional regulator with GAF, ATPase, and Fis domain
VLFTGETGVGKEVHAQALHRASGRQGAFVTIDCAAIPEHLLESELFGYARGAHSTRCSQGRAVRAGRGGHAVPGRAGRDAPAAQSKLLRFLQSRQVLSLGSTQPRSLDVRVIAATHRDHRLADGRPGLRADLAHRLGPARSACRRCAIGSRTWAA